MSSPVHNDLDKRSMYAPPWAREVPQQPPEAIIEAIEQLRQERARTAQPPANDEAVAERQPRLLRDRNQRELPLGERSDPNDIEAAMADAVRASWTPHPLDPVTMPEPPKPRLNGPSVGMVARLGGAVAVAAAVALFVIGAVPLPAIDISLNSLNANEGGKAAAVAAQAIDLREARVMKPAAPAVAADAPAAVTLAVAAVPASATFPAPSVTAPPAPPPVVALPTRVPPPSGALPAEVLTAFASIDTASVAPRVQRMDVPPAVAPMPKLPEFRALDRDELAGLVKRGEMLLLEGDVSSARLLLRRAAEAGDANATLMMASTFDRAELARLKVIGIAPDDAQAKTWYAKAVELGSAEAVRRLQQFAQR
jgi:hypothetical protein